MRCKKILYTFTVPQFEHVVGSCVSGECGNKIAVSLDICDDYDVPFYVNLDMENSFGPAAKKLYDIWDDYFANSKVYFKMFDCNDITLYRDTEDGEDIIQVLCVF